MLAPALCSANPEGGVISAGEANITESGSNVTINQNSYRAVIDWRSFDISPNEITQFKQPSNESVTLNRIHSDNASTIAGKLTANGNIVLINQNGFLFTKDSIIDVNGIIATTSDIGNNDFMNGKMEFTKPGNPDAIIINEGSITAKEAGLVGIVAPQVINNGLIVANGGTVQLSSGDTFTVDMYGDKLMEVVVSDKLKKQLVKNKGMIEAKGGKIILTAAAGKEIIDSLITVKGELRSPAVADVNGEIYIFAEGSNAVPRNVRAQKGVKKGKSRVEIAAKLDSSGTNPGEKGGKISILGDEVNIRSKTIINASGTDGLVGTTTPLEVSAHRIGSAGGDIRIGGDYLGSGDTPNAKYLLVEEGAQIYSNSRSSGDAGRNIFWADDVNIFSGTAYSQALGENGNGGFIETSGKKQLIAEGNVDISSANGIAGTWLLDPGDIVISAGGNSNITGSSPFTANATGGSVLNTTTLQNALASGNVVVSTSNDGYTTNGDITVSSTITVGAGNYSLTLSAYQNININAAITMNGGDLTLISNNAGTVNNGACFTPGCTYSTGTATSGGIRVVAAIITNGGAVTISGGLNGYGTAISSSSYGVEIGASVSAGGGNIFMAGTGHPGSSGSRLGVGIYSSTVSTTGSGSITCIGYGGGTTAGNAGNNFGTNVALTAILSSVDGAINLTGKGGGFSTSTGDYGVQVRGAINVAGLGTITLTGTGGTGSGAAEHGVNFTGTLSTTNKAINITGTGGTTGSSGHGVQIVSGSSITSGTAATTITGQYGFGGDDIYINQNIATTGTTNLLSNCAPCGTIYVNNAYTLAGPMIINAGATGTAQFNNTMNGAQTLGITAATISPSSAWGGGTALSSVNFNSTFTLGGNLALTTSGAISFSSSINGTANYTQNLTLTSTGGAITLGGTIGGTVPLGDVSINALNTITLPAISANSIFVKTTGAAANIITGGNLTTSATTGTGLIPAATIGATNVTNYSYGVFLYPGLDFNNSGNYTISNKASTYWAVLTGDAISNTNIIRGALVGNNYTGCSYANPITCTSGGISAGSNDFLFVNNGSTTINLTISGTSIINKIYDGTNLAYLNLGSLVGVLAIDVGNVILTENGSYAQVEVGTGITVYISAALSGLASSKYTLTAPGNLVGNIYPRPLTVTGTLAANKVYDGTNNATITGGTLNNVVTGETITLSQAGTFSSSNAGMGIAVNMNGIISGITAANYVLTQPSGIISNITPSPLTVIGTMVASKTYDSTTTASLSGGTLSGKIYSGDKVNLMQSGNFISKNVGQSVAVIASDSIDNSNYQITQPAGLSANISKANLTVNGTIVEIKNIQVQLTGGSLQGVYPGDHVNLIQSDYFTSLNSGANPVIAAYYITGLDAGNYNLIQPQNLVGNMEVIVTQLRDKNQSSLKNLPIVM